MCAIMFMTYSFVFLCFSAGSSWKDRACFDVQRRSMEWSRRFSSLLDEPVVDCGFVLGGLWSHFVLDVFLRALCFAVACFQNRKCDRRQPSGT